MSITLRPFTREEYHEFWQQYEPDPVMDPRPYRYNREHTDRNFDYDQMRKEWYPVFGIFVDDTTPVGSLSLKRIDTLYKRCELGIVMANDRCKGQGWGTEAIRQGIRIAHDTYGVNTILADTMGCNQRMQHILMKLGFQFQERIKNVYDMSGRMEDKLDYVLDVSNGV